MNKNNELNVENLTFLLPTIVGKQQFGWSNQTTYNHIYRNDFPFPLYLIGKTKMVKVDDIQRVINNLKPVQTFQSTPPSRKPGRPTKAAQIAAAALKSGVSA